ncbi:hypothetical protein BD560DRAFT_147647 [Blakeslea trispora]|nr:hypothetical protein BD560DRAFT_147647 [Blakeslea trispora]
MSKKSTRSKKGEGNVPNFVFSLDGSASPSFSGFSGSAPGSPTIGSPSGSFQLGSSGSLPSSPTSFRFRTDSPFTASQSFDNSTSNTLRRSQSDNEFSIAPLTTQASSGSLGSQSSFSLVSAPTTGGSFQFTTPTTTSTTTPATTSPFTFGSSTSVAAPPPTTTTTTTTTNSATSPSPFTFGSNTSNTTSATTSTTSHPTTPTTTPATTTTTTTPATTTSKPAFSFGTPQTTTTNTPSTIGTQASTIKPAINLNTSETTTTTTTKPTTPSFSFGTPSTSTSTSTSSTPSTSAFSFGKPTESKTTNATEGEKTSATASTTIPSFSFGAKTTPVTTTTSTTTPTTTTSTTTTTPATTTATSTSNSKPTTTIPSFTFGNDKEKTPSTTTTTNSSSFTFNSTTTPAPAVQPTQPNPFSFDKILEGLAKIAAQPPSQINVSLIAPILAGLQQNQVVHHTNFRIDNILPSTRFTELPEQAQKELDTLENYIRQEGQRCDYIRQQKFPQHLTAMSKAKKETDVLSQELDTLSNTLKSQMEHIESLYDAVKEHLRHANDGCAVLEACKHPGQGPRWLFGYSADDE